VTRGAEQIEFELELVKMVCKRKVEQSHLAGIANEDATEPGDAGARPTLTRSIIVARTA
jgi:hypothetical protein